MRALLALLVSCGHALRVPQLAPRPARLRCGAPLLSAGLADLEQTIQQTVAAEPVVIYSKSWCPYCAQCKALFDDMSQPYTAIELDEREDGEQLQTALLGLTQQRTVPNVFVCGQHLGGNDDTQAAARSGKLAAMLEAPPAAFVGRVVPTGGSAPKATAAQLKAAEEGKMITETESIVRKVIGVGLGLATAATYATSGMAYPALAGGIFGSIATYRTGAEYQ